MSEQSMSDFLSEKIEEWIAANGGGFLTGFVAMVDTVAPDGGPTPFVSASKNQPTYRSLGMADYLGEWFRDDAHRAWMAPAPDCCDEDDD